MKASREKQTVKQIQCNNKFLLQKDKRVKIQVMINKTETSQLATQHFEGLCHPSGEEIQLKSLMFSTC